jgi:hypothetical protein
MSQFEMEKSWRALISELNELNSEIRLARGREIGAVMDGLLRVMEEWSISIAELDLYRCRRVRALAMKTEFRSAVTGESWNGCGAPPKWFVQPLGQTPLGDIGKAISGTPSQGKIRRVR